jgi:hypothetical protein
VGEINGKEQQIDKTKSFFFKKDYENRQLLAELGN